MVDCNAPPNSCTFGKAPQEFGLSSGLSNFRCLSLPQFLTENMLSMIPPVLDVYHSDFFGDNFGIFLDCFKIAQPRT